MQGCSHMQTAHEHFGTICFLSKIVLSPFEANKRTIQNCYFHSTYSKPWQPPLWPITRSPPVSYMHPVCSQNLLCDRRQKCLVPHLKKRQVWLVMYTPLRVIGVSSFCSFCRFKALLDSGLVIKWCRMLRGYHLFVASLIFLLPAWYKKPWRSISTWSKFWDHFKIRHLKCVIFIWYSTFILILFSLILVVPSTASFLVRCSSFESDGL